MIKILYIKILLIAILLSNCSNKLYDHGIYIEKNTIKDLKKEIEFGLSYNELIRKVGTNHLSYRIDKKDHLLYIYLQKIIPPIKKDFVIDMMIYEFIVNNNKVVKLNQYDVNNLNQIARNQDTSQNLSKKDNIFIQILGNIGRISGSEM